MKLNYLRTAAEHHLDSVACRRPLPQKKSHGSFLQSFLLLAALLLAGSGVSWGQKLPTASVTLSDGASTPFALVNTSAGKAIYGSSQQNLAYDVYSTAFTDASTGYCFVLEKPTNGTYTYGDNDYLLKFLTRSNTDYSLWGNEKCYLNSQSGGTAFVLGLTGQNSDKTVTYVNGQDMDNGAIWTITDNGNGTFKLQNKATGKYLAGNNSNDTGDNWSFCSVGDGCKVEFSANDGSMGSVTATVNGTSINSGDNVAYGTQVVLTAHPNSGYVFKSWSNSETTQTRTWTVTQSGHPTANFEAGYTVTFGPNKSGWGTVTATVNGQTITSGTAVASGTQVQFTTTAASSDYLTWGWKVNDTDNWSFPNPYTVTENVTIIHKFTRGYKISAVSSNGDYGSVVATNGSQNGNDIHVTPYPYQGVTFKATPKSGCSLVGWYYDVNCTNQVTATDKVTVSGNDVTFADSYFPGVDDETSKSNAFTLWAKFKSDKHIIGKPNCGGVYMDQTKLNAGGSASLAISGGAGTVTAGTGDSYVSFNFDNTYDLSKYLKWTIGCDNNANVNSVEFLKNGNTITGAHFYSSVINRTLSDDNKALLTEVDEIRVHFKENTTTKINFIYLEIDHEARKTPTLASPTAAEMKIFADETLQLRITDDKGFWREYTADDYKTETTTHGVGVKSDGSTDWKPSYDITGLTPGDYYFGIKDGSNCENNKYHESSLVKVHVTVIPSIKSVDVNGTKRQYDVYAPEGISGNVGVVISLHGASNDYDNGRVNFNDIANSEKSNEGKKFVVVYPRGQMHSYPGFNGGAAVRGWDSYTEDNTDDVDFFKALVKQINDDTTNGLTVDYNRIYLAGFSNGGMMTYKAAHQAGDFFSAFASVGGFPVNESHLFHAGAQPTPFIHIHGEKDTMVGMSAYNVNAIIHNMIYRNGAQFTPLGTGDGIVGSNTHVTSDCHAAADGGAVYYFYKVDELEHNFWHDWTGDDVDDIASTMWAFFNKGDKIKNIDETLKFRLYDKDNFWTYAKAGSVGFDNVDQGTSVLSYGGYTNKTGSGDYNQTTNNKNVYHSLQFKGGPHYLKLNMETQLKSTEVKTEFFMVTLTKTGESTPIFSKRYQAGRGQKDLYINFNAVNGWNEYKLVIIKSSESLDVKVHGVEFHSGYCEDAGAEENPTAFYTIDEVVRDMKPIYQPVYGKTYDGLAKEYIPIADIPANDKVTISDNLGVEKLASSITTDTNGRFANTAISRKDGEDTTHKSKNVYIIGTGDINTTYGFNISAQGRAKMPEYLAGTEISFPTHGVLAMQVQGTLDLTFLSYNVNSTDANRRMLKAYYTNDQLDGELKELKSWDFYGTRNEDNANGLQPLNLSIRMQHLGQDGTCKVFVSYEGRQENGTLVQNNDDNDDVWIKGIVVKRPDLKVTIGRTDKLRYTNGDSNNDNCDLTCFDENKPYQWNFGTAGFTNTKKSDLEKKKVNQFDGRTYISGVGPNGEELKDHVLVYSEGLAGDNEKAKVQFDGRPSNGKHKGYEDDATDNNEHIEFTNPTVYTIDANRRDMFPVESNGLKVNVTGSGWFTVAASAPNGPVRMKILSSNNGGTAYTNVLREFVVDNENDADKGQAGYNKETSWKTYRVYLKAHTDKDGTQGFWHGNDKRVTAKKNHQDVEITDPEMMQMSLYVVFDAIGNNYTDPKTNEAATPQLNIHYMQWINELPADYVFQQEEDPRLLNSLQHIKGNGTDEKPDLYWQAGTSLVEKQKTITPAYSDGSGTYDAETYYSAYNSRSYTDREGGETSDPDDISAGLGCTWNVGAMPNTKAHTEENYATYGNTESAFDSFDLLYDLDKAKSDNADYSDKNHEFAIPVSGSFLRFMPMKNQFISAWIVPQDSVASTIYVLDETGEPIPFCEGAGYGDDDDVNKVTQAARERGWVNKADGLTEPAANPDGTYPSIFGATDKSNAARIDFAALAGKEYFIVANGDGAISLARLQATDNASRAKVEEISEAVTLTDNADNSSIITNAMSGTGRYASADKAITLKRTFASGKWASLVLPFSMNEKKFEEVFGLGAKCLHFTKVDKETNTIVFTHHFYNMVVAGRPVFVYPTQEVKNPVFTDVTLSAETVTNTNTNGGDFTFQASYDNATISKGDLFMNNQNGTNYWTGTDNSYPGMRSFIKNNNNWDFSTGVNTTQQTKAVFLNFDEMLDEDIATSIDEYVRGEFGENAVVITKSTKAYDLNGRVVADGANISHLPAGIYIVNGKKFIVK